MSPSATLRYTTVPARSLDAGLERAWTSLIPAEGDYGSPFFRPEYTRGVAAVRDGIEVCVIQDDDGAVGFYPFERIDAHSGRPVGGGMSNFQAVIGAPDLPWTALDLARGAGLRQLVFHHQVRGQQQFDDYTNRVVASPIIDVGGGWDAYLQARRAAGVSSFNALPRKMRKIERELGPITFVPHTDEASVLDSLVEWKRAQYVRTDTRGSLSHDWAVDVLRSLMRYQEAPFAGTLSALYAGDRLIAAHAGIRSASVWHYWYPTYDPAVSQLSPGLVLIHEMCRWAADAGLHRIDLGPGEGAHKELFGTGETSVALGRIDVPQRLSIIGRVAAGLRRRLSRSRGTA